MQREGQFAAEAHEQMQMVRHEDAGALRPMAVGLDGGNFSADSGGDVVVREAFGPSFGAESQKIRSFGPRNPVASERAIAAAGSVHGVEMNAMRSASKLAAYTEHA